MKLKGINTSYIGWIIVIGVIICLYLFYFLSYIPHQEALLQERSFRILKEYSNNMHGKYDYYRTHLANFGDYYTIRFNLETGTPEEIKRKKERFNKRYSNINEVIKGLDNSIKADSELTNSAFLNQTSDKQAYIVFKPQNEDSETSSNPGITGWGNISRSDEFNDEVEFRVPVSTFMEGLKFDQLLNNIVLFDDSAVIYNSNLEVVHDITNPGALADSLKHQQGGMAEIIKIRGEKKRMMIVPINFVGKRFYLAGIIPDVEFKKKTRAINNQVLIVISGLLLLVLVGMPVLKVMYVDPRDRMNAGDSHRAALSMILGTGILVLITIGLLNHQFSDRKNQRKRLASISETIYSNVNSDFQLITGFYRDIINKESTVGLSQFVKQSLLNTNFTQIPKDSATPFPLNEVILMDSAGLVRKAVTRTAFSEAVPVNVSGRMYFRNVLDTNKSWLLKKINERYYIESIKSYNTGNQETAISFHLKEPLDSLAVLAITSVVPSLYNQILPEDVEFIVINETGNVMFHSIRSKNLHENFLDEIGLNARLISAMQLRLEESTQIKYNEKPWMANIKPIRDTPLYLVTLLDIQHAQNRNTRVFLFTFYFLFVSLICVTIGMLIIRLSKPQNRFIKSESWLLNWLLFQPQNYMKYKILLFALSLILICQLLGLVFIEKPVIMLIYQLIFITCSGLISMIVLGKGKLPFYKIHKKANLPAALIILILVVLIILLFRFTFQWTLILPFILFALVLWFTTHSLQHHFFKQPEHQNNLQNLPYFPYRVGEKNTEPSPVRKRNLYNLCFFMWLLILAVVPVINYYQSVQKQEKMLWQREQMSQIAYKNLLLAKSFENSHSASWYGRLQGNGMDGLEITYCDTCFVDSISTEKSIPDDIYALLTDPVTKSDYQMTYLNNKSYLDDWKLENSELEFSTSGIRGTIQIKVNENKHQSFVIWLFFLILLTGVLLIIWFVLCYVTEHILYTKQNIWKKPKNPSLNELLSNQEIRRILLYSFEEKQLQEAARNSGTNDFKTIPATDLISGNYKAKTEPETKNQMIWINEFDQYVEQVEKHPSLLSGLKDILRNYQGKIVVFMPFETDFINEYYEDYIAENEIEKKERTEIYVLKRSWENLFKDFRECYDSEIETGNKNDDKTEHNSEFQPFYSYIWNNLCRAEKLILYDLAEDGLLNLKNKRLIFHLMKKGLIVPDQYLEIYSDGFREYIKTTVKPEEVKKLESKLIFKGMWRNMRYPIIIVLVILAAFIFISQGYSIEKVTAIFAGILTLLAGMVRLFESSVFR